MSKPTTFVELLARQVDMGWGADPDNPLTQEIADRFAACDLIIERVVKALIASDPDERGRNSMLGDQGGVARCFGIGLCSPRAGDTHDLRKQLGAAFGAAINEDLRVQAKINQEVAERAQKEVDDARSKQYLAEAKAGELERELRLLRLPRATA